MITVQFGKRIRKGWSDSFSVELVTIDTGCESIEDAYKVALANGHDPNKMIRWWNRDEQEGK